VIRYQTRTRGNPRLLISGLAKKAIWDLLKDMTGVSRTSSYVVVPADPRIYELLVETFKETPNELAAKWYQYVTAKELVRAKFLAREDCTIPHKYASKLLPFQRVGAAFMAATGRILLCDDTGLGKTVQAIVGVEMSKAHETVLVVAPNTLRLWWKAEYKSWSQEPKAIELLQTSKAQEQLVAFRGGWLIVNYRQLLLCGALVSIAWDWVVFDEGHALCNRKTQTCAVARQLAKKSVAIISATPYGNDTAELWALLNIIEPKRYSSYWRFFELYVDSKPGYFGGQEILGPRNTNLLKRDLASRMIRRHKHVVYPQLPAKVHQVVPLAMDDAQHKLYKQMAKSSYLELSDGSILTASNAISVMTRLRQILSTPAAFELPDTSIKLDFVMEFLRSTQEKVVVFTLFRATVIALGERLTQVGISYAIVWGGLQPEDVEQARESFKKGEVQVLIGTIQSAGTGLNLRDSSCNTMIFVDRHFNPTKQKQAEGRIHGIGQTNKVHIYVLHCPKTVDELVRRILQRKLVMTQAILESMLLEHLVDWLD